MVADDAGPGAVADLAAVVALAGAVAAAVLFPDEVPFAAAIRRVGALPLLLFVPGYAVVTALYPRTRPETMREGEGATGLLRRDALTAVERFILSVTASLMLVGLVALASNYAPSGVSVEPVVAGLGAITLVAAAVAAGRRLALPPETRSGVTLGGLLSASRRRLAREFVDTPLDVAVVASVVVALAVVAVQPFGAPASEQFSEYQLLAEQDDGSLAATDYPSEFDGDESVFVRIQNHEGRTVNYTVVVKLQRVSEVDGDLRTTRAVVVDRFSLAVDAGETRTVEHTPSPTMTGSLRLVYLFYVGEVPDDPTRETADGALHLWIDVTDAAGGDTGPTTEDGERDGDFVEEAAVRNP